MKKIYGIFASILFCFCSFAVVGCGNTSVEIAKDITEKVKESQTYLSENVFSKTSGTDFNSTTSASYLKDENLFVLVAGNVDNNVSIIKLGEVVYDASKETEFSIGNTNTLKRKPFMVKENNLYIASLILLLNAKQDGRLNISFPNNKINAFEIEAYKKNENKLTGSLINQGTAELKEVDGVYTFKSDKFNNSVFVKLDNGENNITQNDIIITERVISVGENNQSKVYGYGKADSPVGQQSYGTVFYPAYNNGQEYTSTTPKSHKVQFNIYCVGIGSYHFTMDFVNTTSS